MATLNITVEGSVDVRVEGGPVLEAVPVSFHARSSKPLEELLASGELMVSEEGAVKIQVRMKSPLQITIPIDVLSQVMMGTALEEWREVES